MQSISSEIPVAPRRRRSSASDPLKKVTFQLSESVVDAIKTVVEAGEVSSANVFVEAAVRASLRERRRARIYAAYEEAARDPVFMNEMKSELAGFDSTLADGSSGDR